MPTLQTTESVTGLTALTAGVNFTGLVVLSPGPTMDRVGCCDFAEECLILQVADGQLTQAQLYRDGDPTSSGLTDITLPYTLPPTTGDEYYRLGYLAGSVVDRLANLPVQNCRDCFTYELTVPTQDSLEINQFPANSQIAGTTAANINALQTQVNELLANVDNLGAANNNLQVQLTASQADLASTNNDLTTANETLQTTQTSLSDANATIATLNEQLAALQSQVDQLNQADQDSTAAATAAQAVRSEIAALTLRDQSICTTAQTVISSDSTTTSTSTSTSTTVNETTQALSGGARGKVVQLRPDIAKADCDSNSSGQRSAASSTPASASTQGSAAALTTSGRVLNFSQPSGRLINGCSTPAQPPTGCCTPGKKPDTTPQAEDTRSAIARALSGASPFVPSVPPQVVCEEIEREKKKLLVRPGCSDNQEISAEPGCKPEESAPGPQSSC